MYVILDVQVSVSSVQDLAEFTGAFSEMLIAKGKVTFQWKGIFVEISLL